MTSTASDQLESLHRKALSGGAAEENQLFEALSARFRLIAANRVWDRQDALDVAQEALMIVHRKYRCDEALAAFTGWAYKVLQNKVLEYYRTTSRRTGRILRADIEDRQDASTNADPDLDRMLKRCLREIIAASPRYGRILVNVYQGYSSDEICTRLAITKSNFYTTLSRARSLLKQCLGYGADKQ